MSIVRECLLVMRFPRGKVTGYHVVEIQKKIEVNRAETDSFAFKLTRCRHHFFIFNNNKATSTVACGCIRRLPWWCCHLFPRRSPREIPVPTMLVDSDRRKKKVERSLRCTVLILWLRCGCDRWKRGFIRPCSTPCSQLPPGSPFYYGQGHSHRWLRGRLCSSLTAC